MPLSVIPEPIQIANVRDAAHLSNSTDAEFYIKRLNDSEWTLTLEDLTEWLKVKNKVTKIKGDGVEIDKADLRLILTNRIRNRFGLQPLDENGRIARNRFDENCGGIEFAEIESFF